MLILFLSTNAVGLYYSNAGEQCNLTQMNGDCATIPDENIQQYYSGEDLRTERRILMLLQATYSKRFANGVSYFGIYTSNAKYITFNACLFTDPSNEKSVISYQFYPNPTGITYYSLAYFTPCLISSVGIYLTAHMKSQFVASGNTMPIFKWIGTFGSSMSYTNTLNNKRSLHQLQRLVELRMIL